MDILMEIAGSLTSISSIMYIGVGVFVGLCVGAVPGLSAPMAIAIAVPLTYHMPMVTAIGFLIGINKGGIFGGSIAAVLLNTPGTAEAAATTYDGHALARQGKGLKAIKMALYASVFGDMFATLILILVGKPIASVALHLGPAEVCGIILFALTLIASLEARNLATGMVAAAFGMLLGTIGLDPVSAEPRLTLGFFQLEGGLAMVPLCLGVLAFSEVILQLEMLFRSRNTPGGDAALLANSPLPADRRVSWKEFWTNWKTLVRSSLIGSGIGAIPGLGAPVAAFLAYGIAKKTSAHPESIGKGSLEGIAAPESANNAVVSAALIPLFTLGIPGSIGSALLIGAFMLHGVSPGPLMFEQNLPLVYGIYGAILLGNVLLLVIGHAGIGFFTRLLSAPKNILVPIIMFCCLIGAYISSTSFFEVYTMIVFGFIGYFLKKVQFSFVCMIVGFLLGPIFELSLQQTILTFGHTPVLLLDRPVFVCTLLITCVFGIWQIATHKR